MAKHLAWSHSRLSAFRECPKKLYHTQVAKRGHPDRVDQEQSQAMADGLAIDNALTERIAANKPLPPQYQVWEPTAAAVCAAPGVKLTQVRIAFDEALRPCGYTDWDNAWLRVIYDLAIVRDQHGVIWDWKNGKVKADHEQLKLFAATAFMYWPELEKVDTSYVWLSHGITTDKSFSRRELQDIWASFMPDVERMQVANSSGKWAATPSNMACKWCPVNKEGKCSSAAVKHGSVR